MRRKKVLEPSRLSQLAGLRLFDQENGMVAPAAADGRYRDEEHTAVPETSQHVSFSLR